MTRRIWPSTRRVWPTTVPTKPLPADGRYRARVSWPAPHVTDIDIRQGVIHDLGCPDGNCTIPSAYLDEILPEDSDV